MIAKFFLERPIFAAVISIIITLLGFACLKSLPLEQYPKITPPMISVVTQFPGATAQTMAESVAAPLEQAINGIEDLIYMYSQNASPGYLNLNLYFEVGSDPDLALTNAQNRVNLALSALPEEVRRQGIAVSKQFPSILLFIAIESPGGVYDDIFVANYANIYVAEELQRLKGISRAQVLNARDYSMRIWLKPDRMAQFSLTTSDVVHAIQNQNAIRSIGEIGQEPTVSDVELTIPINSLGRLKEPKQFENIIIRANAEGAMVLLKDVGRVELGAQKYEVIGKLNGKKGAYIAIYQDSGANAIDVGNRARAKMVELAKHFPKGIEYSVPYDTTHYIKYSIQEVEWTLFEAALLVSLVIWIFLHSLRATIIPVVAMIISIVGTFIGIYFLGFSINTLTLFGLVLSIGIVVDDAIIVVENVERNMRELALSSKEAAIQTMKEVSGPIIAIVLVLCSVFVPVAFIGGIPGQFYKQFALTIVVSVIISGFVALTLSPVLSVILLKKHKEPGRFGTVFNQYFERFTNAYIRGADWILKRTFVGWGIFVAILVAVVVLARICPIGFVPTEDQGYLVVTSSLPDGASLSRTEEVTQKIEAIAKRSPATQDILSFSGYSLVESIVRSRAAGIFINLKEWRQRKAKHLQAAEVIKTLNRELASIPEARVTVLNPPSIPGISFVGGFDFWIVNQGDVDMTTLNDVVNQIVAKAEKRPEFDFFITSIQANCMELYLDLDIPKTKSLGVNVEEVYQTLQTLLGSVFINNFNKYGRVFQVVAQAEPTYRDTIEDIGNVFVRSQSGHMIPLKSLVIPRFASGPTLVSHFNGSPAALITVAPKIIDAQRIMSSMEEIANEFLVPGLSVAWGGIAYQEKTSGGVSVVSVIGGLLIVFLVLAALYERWSLPLTILLSVPFAIFGAFLAIWLRGMPNDIYFQIGIVTLIGLAAKNAILIVEFARIKRKEGLGVTEAALEAARLRLRAILMTSLTFIFGALPLVISSGAGALSRHSVGTGIIGGMILATFLAVFFVPFFFKIIEERAAKRKKDE